MSSILSFCDITRNKYPPQQVVAFYQHQNINYQQFLADIAHLAQQLQQHPAERWALFDEETYPFAVALFALLACHKKIVIPGNITEATLESLHTCTDASIGTMPGAALRISTLTPAGSEACLPEPVAQNNAITIFTSGSTGQPKAIHKSLEQFSHELNALEQCWGADIGKADIVATVSHQHIYGLIFRVLWPLASGRIFHSERALDPALAIKEAIDSKDGAIWIASPAHLKRLHENLPWAEARQKLKRIFSSGGPLPADAAQQLQLWHGHSATEVYGSSETGGIAWREQYSAITQWQPLPAVQVKANEDGRLLVKSAHIDPANWYATDDKVSLLDDGSFILNGRLDRIIKLEEKRLSLVELEQALLDSAWVKEAFCFLLAPEKNLRETLAAVIVLNADGQQMFDNNEKNLLIKALKNALGLHFELSLLPRKWRFVQQIPVNEQGKINHAALQGLFSHNE